MRYLLSGVILLFIILAGCEHGVSIQEENGIKKENETKELNENIKENPVNITTISIQDNDLIDLFHGVWTNKEQPDIFLELQDGVELIGVMKGQLMTRTEYTITEVNTKEKSIVLHGYSEDISYDEESEKKEFTSKLYLRNNGEELLYINDYLGEKLESEWIK